MSDDKPQTHNDLGLVCPECNNQYANTADTSCSCSSVSIPLLGANVVQCSE